MHQVRQNSSGDRICRDKIVLLLKILISKTHTHTIIRQDKWVISEVQRMCCSGTKGRNDNILLERSKRRGFLEHLQFKGLWKDTCCFDAHR